MITLLYAGLCTLLVVLLAGRVVQWRFRHKIGIGDGGDRELLKRVRVHANAVENMPLAGHGRVRDRRLLPAFQRRRAWLRLIAKADFIGAQQPLQFDQ